jgi:hypothetical protein
MDDSIDVARRFGANLRRVRKQADLSQEEVGSGPLCIAPRSACLSAARESHASTPWSSSRVLWA